MAFETSIFFKLITCHVTKARRDKKNIILQINYERKNNLNLKNEILFWFHGTIFNLKKNSLLIFDQTF